MYILKQKMNNSHRFQKAIVNCNKLAKLIKFVKKLSCRIKCEKEYKKFFSHLFFAVHGKVIKILKQKIILKQLLKK